MLAVGACGDDDDDSNGSGGAGGGGGATTLELAADPGGALKFNTASLTAKPGTVTISFDNPSRVPHAVEVDGMGVEEETETGTEAKAELSDASSARMGAWRTTRW